MEFLDWLDHQEGVSVRKTSPTSFDGGSKLTFPAPKSRSIAVLISGIAELTIHEFSEPGNYAMPVPHLFEVSHGNLLIGIKPLINEVNLEYAKDDPEWFEEHSNLAFTDVEKYLELDTEEALSQIEAYCNRIIDLCSQYNGS